MNEEITFQYNNESFIIIKAHCESGKYMLGAIVQDVYIPITLDNNAKGFDYLIKRCKNIIDGKVDKSKLWTLETIMPKSVKRLIGLYD
jgi:hypothetical protein